MLAALQGVSLIASNKPCMHVFYIVQFVRILLTFNQYGGIKQLIIYYNSSLTEDLKAKSCMSSTDSAECICVKHTGAC